MVTVIVKISLKTSKIFMLIYITHTRIKMIWTNLYMKIIVKSAKVILI